MSTWTATLLLVGQLALVLLLAPWIRGLIKTLKARMQGRRGPGLLQPYADLMKMLHKSERFSEHTTWIFRATPYLVFASALTVAALVPTVWTPLPVSFVGDAIVVIYLLAFGAFFTALAGLDAASAFGGMGSSREMMVMSLIEPAMMLAVFTVAVTAGTTDLSSIVSFHVASGGISLAPAQLLAFAGLFLVALAENGRIPVDNPSTHLELTMMHEAMVLEYSGRSLALLEWAGALKLLIFFSLLANAFFPLGIAMETQNLPWGLGAYALKVVALAAAVAATETVQAKLRLFRLPDVLAIAFVLSLMALIMHFLGRGGI